MITGLTVKALAALKKMKQRVLYTTVLLDYIYFFERMS